MLNKKLARKNELKAKSTLLLAIPDEHLLKFYGIKDAKTLWEAIKASQLEIHGKVISQEDANLKLLRSLPLAWNNIALIMRNKSDLDTLSMDDLYNNLKVYKSEIKVQSRSSSNSQNVDFVSLDNTSSTNKVVNAAHEVSTASSQGQASSSTYADDVMFSFFANQSNSGHAYHEGEKILKEDMKESEFHWQRNCYQMGLESLEARIVVHEKNEAIYEEDIAFLKFKTGEGFHAVPPPYTGNYMPSRPDLSFVGLDDFDTDSDNDSVFRPKSDQTKPKFTKINFVKSDVNVKSVNKENTHRAATSISTVRLVNTADPKTKVNDALPTTYSYFKAHSLVKRTFNQKSAAKTNKFNEKVNTARVNNVTTAGPKAVGNPQYTLQDQGIFDSGCSRHMTGNKSFLTDYQEIDGGFVAFGGSPKGGKITGKGKIRTGKLDFEDVYFVKELKFNLFSVSQMCDKKNNVLFTETECLVLSPDFKLLDESQVLLKVPRQNNMYSFDLKNVVPSGGLTCLFAKAIIDESNLWL
ncbi:hypothetical protein Tco_0259776 [Tanacetum coccineum]